MSTQTSLPESGIGEVFFFQDTDLVKLEYRVNDWIARQLAEGVKVLSVVLNPYFVVGEYDYFATITVAIGDEE